MQEIQQSPYFLAPSPMVAQPAVILYPIQQQQQSHLSLPPSSVQQGPKLPKKYKKRRPGPRVPNQAMEESVKAKKDGHWV